MTLYTKQPSAKDGRMNSGEPDTNFGSEIRFLTHSPCSPTSGQRSILEFDISDLPAGGVISTAKLKLYYHWYYAPLGDPVGRHIWAYKLTRTDWVESEFTWNIYKTGSNWTITGGDFVTINPDGDFSDVPPGYGWMEWDIKA
ncbi:unnamed protein product, partial [marine sediment metagenome]